MLRCLTDNAKIHKGLLKNIIWCCSNLSDPSVDGVEFYLTSEEQHMLSQIFVNCIENVHRDLNP